MVENTIAVFIPIIFILVTGLVIVTMVFFRSREKQLLIEKGLTPEAIKEFFQNKKDDFRLLKIGVVLLFFGLGLGFGLIMEDNTSKDYWVPFLLFTLTGLGFIAANLIAKSIERKAV